MTKYNNVSTVFVVVCKTKHNNNVSTVLVMVCKTKHLSRLCGGVQD